MTIENNKDVDQIPNRVKFDLISGMDRETRIEDRDLLRVKLFGALRKYLENNPEERNRFKKRQNGIDDISSVYAESLLEASFVLGVKDFDLELESFDRDNLDVPFGVVNYAYMRTNEDSSHAVGINAYEFYRQAEKWATHSPTLREQVQRQIRRSMAEEAAHIYVALKYPQADSKTRVANKESWDSYQEDRGENFARAFAKGYLKYNNLN